MMITFWFKEKGQNMGSMIIDMSGSIPIQHEQGNANENYIGVNGRIFTAQDLNQFKDVFHLVDFVILEKFNFAIGRISLSS